MKSQRQRLCRTASGEFVEGQIVSDAEFSAYLLMAGGLVWIIVGIAGLALQSHGRRDLPDE